MAGARLTSDVQTVWFVMDGSLPADASDVAKLATLLAADNEIPVETSTGFGEEANTRDKRLFGRTAAIRRAGVPSLSDINITGPNIRAADAGVGIPAAMATLIRNIMSTWGAGRTISIGRLRTNTAIARDSDGAITGTIHEIADTTVDAAEGTIGSRSSPSEQDDDTAYSLTIAPSRWVEVDV